MADLVLFVVKLSLATSAFVLIGWFGARDGRVGGVLLTFPLLNGIAMLTGVDPVGIATTIFLIVLWNCALFLAILHYFDRIPGLSAGFDTETIIAFRVACWIVLWAAGASLLAFFRDALPPAKWLFALATVCASIYIARCWHPRRTQASSTFRAMWGNPRGAIRVACFVVTFGVLAVVADFWRDDRWVGWASALPLPGIFALALLSTTQKAHELAALGDTVLLGPLLVIPFNWALAHAIVALRSASAGALAEIMTVMLFWIAAAGFVVVAVPALTRWRDALARSP